MELLKTDRILIFSDEDIARFAVDVLESEGISGLKIFKPQEIVGLEVKESYKGIKGGE